MFGSHANSRVARGIVQRGAQRNGERPMTRRTLRRLLCRASRTSPVPDYRYPSAAMQAVRADKAVQRIYEREELRADRNAWRQSVGLPPLET